LSNTLYQRSGSKPVTLVANDRVEMRTGHGNDIIDATSATMALLLDGGAGDDRIGAGSNHDLIWGGAGNDTLAGGAGDDTLTGEAGDDSLNGGSGNNVLNA
jgi:Ca2+-binding RTX toxin-like protein